MKLLHETTSKSTNQNNPKDTKRHGMFECPVCLQAVEKPLSHGARNKTCGDPVCRKAAFTAVAQDRKPGLNSLEFYSSIDAFYTTLMERTPDKLGIEFKDRKFFIDTTYIAYAAVRRDNQKRPMQIVTSDGSSIVTPDNFVFKVASSADIDISLFSGEFEFCSRRLVTETNYSHSTVKKHLNNMFNGLVEKDLHVTYKSVAKTYLLTSGQFSKAKNILIHNKKRNTASFLYLVKCEQYTKIGIASDLKKRLGSIQGSTPFTIELLHSSIFDKAVIVEKYLHNKYSKFQKHLEWFLLTEEQISDIVEELSTDLEAKILADKTKSESLKKSEDLLKASEQRIKSKEIYDRMLEARRESNVKPKVETNQAVIVVPILAPIIIPADCVRLRSPAFTKLTNITVVADDD